MTLLQYEPLASGADATRMVKVNRDSSGITCSLEQVCLSTVEKDFIAISHVWGEDDKTAEIQINRQSFFVSPQIWQFLHLAADRIPDQRLWIDAICIDQQSRRDKEIQIPLMRQIFSKAQKLVAWLPSAISGWNTSLTSDDPNVSHAEVIASDQYRIPEDLMGTPGGFRALARLLFHPYWSRVWIVQELRLSGEKEFWWEGQIFTSQRLERIATGISTYFTEEGEKEEAKAMLSETIRTNLLRTDQTTKLKATKGSLFDHIVMGEQGERIFDSAHEKSDLASLVWTYRRFGRSIAFDCVFAFLGIAKDCDQFRVQYDVLPLDLLSRIESVSSSMTPEKCSIIGNLLGVDWANSVLMPRLNASWYKELGDVMQALQEITPKILNVQLEAMRSDNSSDVVSRSRNFVQRSLSRIKDQSQFSQRNRAHGFTNNETSFASYTNLVSVINHLDKDRTASMVIQMPALGMYFTVTTFGYSPPFTSWLKDVLKVTRVAGHSETENDEIKVSHAIIKPGSSALGSIIADMKAQNMSNEEVRFPIGKQTSSFRGRTQGFFVAFSRPNNWKSYRFTSLRPATFLALLHMANDNHPVWNAGQRWIIPVGRKQKNAESGQEVSNEVSPE